MTFIRYTVDTPYPVGPVHLYLFERRGELILFDAGPPTRENYLFLRKNIQLDRLIYVFITHSHADHCGGLKFLSDNSDAQLFVPKKDILKNRLHKIILPHYERIFLSFGFPDNVIKEMINVFSSFKKQTVIPDNVKAVEESKLLEIIKFIPFPGHSISDLTYIVDDRYAITGDFLLNGIFQTPLIEIDPETMDLFDNYAAYCMSISKLNTLSNMTILPSHSEVHSPHEVTKFYVDKIIKRASFVHECIKEECTVYDMVKRLTDTLNDPFKAYLKASELVFLKSFVERPDLLKNALKNIGLLEEFYERIENFQNSA